MHCEFQGRKHLMTGVKQHIIVGHALMRMKCKIRSFSKLIKLYKTINNTILVFSQLYITDFNEPIKHKYYYYMILISKIRVNNINYI